MFIILCNWWRVQKVRAWWSFRLTLGRKNAIFTMIWSKKRGAAVSFDRDSK